MNSLDLLTRWRQRARLSQEEAAAVLGYNNAQSISNKERGRTKVTTRDLKLIKTHATANNISLDQ